MWPIITGAAIADSVNPCAFSVLFLTIAFLFSLGKKQKEILIIGGAYILGIYVAYLFIGLGVLQALTIFGVPRIISKAGALILITWGVVDLAGTIWKKFPIKLKMPDFIHPLLAKLIHKGSIPTTLLLGMVVGMSEFPCTGGPYLFILSLLHDKVKFWDGFGYLIWYNLVFVAPLIITLVASSFPGWQKRVQDLRKKNTKQVEIFMAIVLIIMGLLILYV